MDKRHSYLRKFAVCLIRYRFLNKIKMTSKSRTAVGKGKSSVYFQRGMSEEITYEDVLLAQYMDEIQKAPPVRKER